MKYLITNTEVYRVETEEEALEAARYCGYPVMVKASAGGGGRDARPLRQDTDRHRRLLCGSFRYYGLLYGLFPLDVLHE